MPTMPPRLLVPVLLVLCAAAPILAGDLIEVPPAVPVPGSIGELFTPPSNIPLTPPAVPPPSQTAPASAAAPGTQDPSPIPPEAPTWAGLKYGDRERRKLKNES